MQVAGPHEAEFLVGWAARDFSLAERSRLSFGSASSGRSPMSSTGPHAVSFTATSVTLKLGNRDAALPSDRAAEARTLVARVGVWQPQTDPTLPRRRNLPLLIYAPGWGDAYDDNTVLMRTLASHGYGVVAIDDIARDPKAEWATADDEAARLATFDVGTPDRQIQFMIDANRRVELAASKMRAVLEAIANTQATEPSFERFDLDRVGAIGASFGGATAAEAASGGGNIRAAVNLDGLVFGRAADDSDSASVP